MKNLRIFLVFLVLCALSVTSTSSSVLAKVPEPANDTAAEPVVPAESAAPTETLEKPAPFETAVICFPKLSQDFRDRYTRCVTDENRVVIYGADGERTASLKLGGGLRGKKAAVCAIDGKHLFIAFSPATNTLTNYYDSVFVTDENLRGGRKLASGKFTEFGTGTPQGKKGTYVRLLDDGGTAFYLKKDGTKYAERLEKIDPTDWKLLLVNGSHPLPDGYRPELTTLFGYPADKRAAEPLTQMFKAAKSDGVTLTLTSAYRSVAKQQSNWNIYVSQEMARGLSADAAAVEVATYTAVPGYSEHHTGLAFDIVTPSYTQLTEGFENTKAFAWLSENAYKYGFILRYPKGKTDVTGYTYEPWHYRYVGTAYAKDIFEKKTTLEEYLDAVN